MWVWFTTLDGGQSWPWFSDLSIRVCVLCAELATTTFDGHDLCATCYGPFPWPPEERRFLLSLALDVDDEKPPTEAPGALLGIDDQQRHVTLSDRDRNRHVYIIGKTGSGKSSLLRNLILQDMDAGHGIGLIDPHGDLALDLLGRVPDHRRNDVVYFCPTDERSPPFNFLAAPYAPDKLARDILSALKLFFESWGDRMEHILRNALATLLADRVNEPHALADLKRILTSPDYRDTIVSRIDNEDLRAFWADEWPRFPKDAAAPINNKLSEFLMPLSPMARIFGTPQSSLDLDAVMNSGKILLCNLSKGELGESASRLVGGLLTTAAAQAALARVRIPEHERRDWFLFVDEFQNYCVGSFASILSEARKYRLNLTLANQLLGQIPADLLKTIKGNVAVMVCLTISSDDAAAMAKEMTHDHYVDFDESKPQAPSGGPEQILYNRDEARRRYRKKHLTDLARLTLRSPWDHTTFAPASDGYLPPRWQQKEQLENKRAGRLNVLRLNLERLDNPKEYPNVARWPKPLTWPTTSDFLELPPLTAFVKVDRPSNVRRFTITHPPTPPNLEERRNVILERQRAELEAKPTSSPARVPTNAPRTAPAPPPTDPDDFAF